MFEGNCKAAMRLLTDDCRGGFLPLTTQIPSENSQPTTVLDVLISKHPPSQPANPDTIINVNPSNVFIQLFLMALMPPLSKVLYYKLKAQLDPPELMPKAGGDYVPLSTRHQ
jgi:hypothetical protein